MSQQWGGGQPGYQYPVQQGFPAANNQFQQGFGGGITPQAGGFGSARPGFQQPQPSGFQGSQGFQQSQTSFQPGLGGFQQQQPPSGPPQLSNINTNFGGRPQASYQQGSGFLGAPQPPQPQPQSQLQNRSFLGSSSALGSRPLGGYPGSGGGFGTPAPLLSQPPAFIDQSLQLMSGNFLPANPSVPYSQAGGGLQFQAGPQQGGALQQSIQQFNQQSGGSVQNIPWALTPAEKKQYDQIFRAWDSSGSGFISGQVALEVFGQSGLEKNDLAKIWSVPPASCSVFLN